MVSPKPFNVSATSPTSSPRPTNWGIASAIVWVNSPALSLLIPKVLTNLVASVSKFCNASNHPAGPIVPKISLVIFNKLSAAFKGLVTVSKVASNIVFRFNKSSCNLVSTIVSGFCTVTFAPNPFGGPI